MRGGWYEKMELLQGQGLVNHGQESEVFHRAVWQSVEISKEDKDMLTYAF